MQREPQAPTNLTDLTHSLHVIGRRQDDRVFAEKLEKVLTSVQATSDNVNNLCGCVTTMDKPLENILTTAVCAYTDGERVDSLRKLTDNTGTDIVEFDDAVHGEITEENNGEITRRPVLILIDSKDSLQAEDVDLNACTSQKEIDACLPTRAELYQMAYDGLLAKWTEEATKEDSKIPRRQIRRLRKQLALFQELKIRNTELVFAIGGRQFPESLQKFCKEKGYLCFVPNGTGFVVK